MILGWIMDVYVCVMKKLEIASKRVQWWAFTFLFTSVGIFAEFVVAHIQVGKI
jgi:hypothetical protein